jgi:cell wall assembly regulator SMI1
MLQDHDMDRIEAAWRAQGAPTADTLAPGLNADQLDAYEAELGYPLPAELRLWWGRHDGAVGGAWSPGTAAAPRPWFLLSLRESLDERAERLAANDGAEFSEDDQEWEGEWASWWLPLATAGNAWIFADLRAAADGDGSVPVHFYEHVPEDVFRARAPSLGDLITAWATAIEQGRFVYSAGSGRWDIPHPLPAELRQLV